MVYYRHAMLGRSEGAGIVKRIIIFIVVLLLVPALGLGESFQGVNVVSDLTEARGLADFMQEHYDITILIGDECASMKTEGFSLGDDPAGRTPLKDLLNLETYENDLRIIDDCFSVYPGGFFSKFHSPQSAGGLRILLVNSILYNGKKMAGVVTVQDGYINVFLGLGSFYKLNVHHELWHAVEERIKFDNPDVFDSWYLLNPEEFLYSGDDSEMDIWEQAAFHDYWFVRGYSTISEEEDRATVIEAVFLFENDWWAEHVQIRKKLNTMLTAAYPIFGDIYFQKY